MLSRLASIENTWPARPAPSNKVAACLSFSFALCHVQDLSCAPDVVGGEWEVDLERSSRAVGTSRLECACVCVCAAESKHVSATKACSQTCAECGGVRESTAHVTCETWPPPRKGLISLIFPDLRSSCLSSIVVSTPRCGRGNPSSNSIEPKPELSGGRTYTSPTEYLGRGTIF
jgi:hypothetical protein